MKRTGFPLALLRVVTGIIFIAHGWPKIAFSDGIPNTAAFLGQLGIPAPAAAAWFVALLETVGGLALILGIFVTPLAALFIVHMATGIALVHGPRGFYVIGQSEGGYEFSLLMIAVLLTLILAGPGAWALGGRKRSRG